MVGPVTEGSLEYGDPECEVCWEKTELVWSEMAAEDRYTRGAEGGWCDL